MNTQTIPTEYATLVEQIARSPKLMLVSDFDGTIAHFTVDPSRARPDPAAVQALQRLSQMALTDVCIVSGRGLADLAERCREIHGARLVGSHGAEHGSEKSVELSSAQRSELERAHAIAESLAARDRGVVVERKPLSVAFHVRGAMPELGDRLLDEVAEAFRTLDAGVIKEGNQVLEYLALPASKSHAVERLRNELMPHHVVVIGDDYTDEEMFRSARAEDITVKVGPGPTVARHRLTEVSHVALFLAAVADCRARWIHETPVSQIDHHAFLSDLRTFFLVDPMASVVWGCMPRLDSPPLFGSLVGGPAAGDFSVHVEGVWSQSYQRESAVLETSCVTADGKRVTITDFLDCGGGLPFQRAGRSNLLRWIEGDAPVTVRFAPRIDFGRIQTKLTKIDNGLRVEGGSYPVVLHAPEINWEIVVEGAHQTALTQIIPTRGILCELRMGTYANEKSRRSYSERLQQTLSFWQGWAKSLRLPEVATERVLRSALVLRGLTYGPTGAIAAAASTSLPETIGGVRNWDYRFCWPRDASLSASALLRLGAPGPGIRLLDWILNVLGDRGPAEFLSPLYTVDGREIFGEAEVPEAFGYRGSRPVRVGNLAGQQLQLDALGPIARLLGDLARFGAALTPEHLGLVERMVTLVESYWERPDHGIWEVRTAQRHFVHSKIMCWLTVREGAFVSEYVGRPRPEWERLADRIRADIEEKGFSRERSSYRAAYELDEADAALLWVLLSGFHPPTDPRAIGTLEFVMSQLLEQDALFRYRFPDALMGSEGAFNLCTSWLIECLVMVGRRQEARRLFDIYLKRSGPLGLCAEEWDVRQGLALGNFPQAYSHLGLINCAVSLAEA